MKKFLIITGSALIAFNANALTYHYDDSNLLAKAKFKFSHDLESSNKKSFSFDTRLNFAAETPLGDQGTYFGGKFSLTNQKLLNRKKLYNDSTYIYMINHSIGKVSIGKIYNSFSKIFNPNYLNLELGSQLLPVIGYETNLNSAWRFDSAMSDRWSMRVTVSPKTRSSINPNIKSLKDRLIQIEYSIPYKSSSNIALSITNGKQDIAYISNDNVKNKIKSFGIYYQYETVFSINFAAFDGSTASRDISSIKFSGVQYILNYRPKPKLTTYASLSKTDYQINKPLSNSKAPLFIDLKLNEEKLSTNSIAFGANYNFHQKWSVGFFIEQNSKIYYKSTKIKSKNTNAEIFISYN